MFSTEKLTTQSWRKWKNEQRRRESRKLSQWEFNLKIFTKEKEKAMSDGGEEIVRESNFHREKVPAQIQFNFSLDLYVISFLICSHSDRKRKAIFTTGSSVIPTSELIKIASAKFLWAFCFVSFLKTKNNDVKVAASQACVRRAFTSHFWCCFNTLRRLAEETTNVYFIYSYERRGLRNHNDSVT